MSVTISHTPLATSVMKYSWLQYSLLAGLQQWENRHSKTPVCCLSKSGTFHLNHSNSWELLAAVSFPVIQYVYYVICSALWTYTLKCKHWLHYGIFAYVKLQRPFPIPYITEWEVMAYLNFIVDTEMFSVFLQMYTIYATKRGLIQRKWWLSEQGKDRKST